MFIQCTYSLPHQWPFQHFPRRTAFSLATQAWCPLATHEPPRRSYLPFTNPVLFASILTTLQIENVSSVTSPCDSLHPHCLLHCLHLQCKPLGRCPFTNYKPRAYAGKYSSRFQTRNPTSRIVWCDRYALYRAVMYCWKWMGSRAAG